MNIKLEYSTKDSYLHFNNIKDNYLEGNDDDGYRMITEAPIKLEIAVAFQDKMIEKYPTKINNSYNTSKLSFKKMKEEFDLFIKESKWTML